MKTAQRVSPLFFYAHYANRARGERATEEDGEGLPAEDEPPKKRRCSASWARLISRIFHADPLTCRKCGAKLKVVAYLHDTVAIRQILDYLGLSPPEEPKPPPAAWQSLLRSRPMARPPQGCRRKGL
jgi:hypothetical protein